MNFHAMTDGAIEAELGSRLAAQRLRKNITQEDIALALGVSRTTYNQLEKGKGKLSTLIAAMRYLNCLDELNNFLPATQFSPLAALKLSKRSGRLAGKVIDRRQRARPSNTVAGKVLKQPDSELDW